MIFITGCTGLVGSHLTASLVNRQQTTDNSRDVTPVASDVTNIASDVTIVEPKRIIKLLCRKNSDLSLLKRVLARYGFNDIPENIEFIYGDVTDYDILEEAMKDVHGAVDEEAVRAVVERDIDKINNDMPKYKHIHRFIVQKEEMVKTTTGKVKRYEESKK